MGAVLKRSRGRPRDWARRAAGRVRGRGAEQAGVGEKGKEGRGTGLGRQQAGQEGKKGEGRASSWSWAEKEGSEIFQKQIIFYF